MSVDEKYCDCNVVQASVTQKCAPPPKKRKSFFWIRLCIGAAAIAAMFGLHYIKTPATQKARDAVKTVVCYDVFGRTDIGCSAYFNEKKYK